MPQVVGDLEHLPLGSHCVSFHVSKHEAAAHAVEFVAGAPPDQAASYWVTDPALASYYNQALSVRDPDHVGCVRVLDGPQATRQGDHLRPAARVREWVADHPGGVTAAGETISGSWGPESVPDYLEYEAWFDDQPRDGSRFLCPYDLRRVPPGMAPSVMRELGAHHSHVVLSRSTEPAVRLMELFVFGRASEIPDALRATLGWALEEGLVETAAPDDELTLTGAGERAVTLWSETAVIDW